MKFKNGNEWSRILHIYISTSSLLWFGTTSYDLTILSDHSKITALGLRIIKLSMVWNLEQGKVLWWRASVNLEFGLPRGWSFSRVFDR